jgi:hypothetical protein
MSGAFDDENKVLQIMADFQKVLLRHLGILPDALVILSHGLDGRTMFAMNPENDTGHSDPRANHPRARMTAMLEQAVHENRNINRQTTAAARAWVRRENQRLRKGMH